MKYKAKECRCWAEYPNEAYQKRNGEWKCIDQYKCIMQGDWKHKTRCVLKEGDKMTREYREYAKSRIEYLLKISSFVFDERDREALEVAIQELSQEPTFDDECQKDMDEAWEQIQKKRKRIPVTLDLTPCDDTVSIRKDAFKTRVGNIVAYNVEWLKKHWQMEMDIVCGVKPCTDAVSREAVIEWLKDKDIIKLKSQEDNARKELGALTSTNPQPCDDAISRDAVIQTLNKMDRYTANELTLCDTDKKFPANEVFIVDDVYEQIAEQLPSVTQKSGKWNEYYTSQKGNNVFNCKECGHTFVVTQGKDNMNYCPNCGCAMKGE